MLDLAAHMEADLGIDSIKRIEVFSGLKDRYNFMEGRDEETVFEELSGHKTLNEIIGWYDQLCDPAGLQGGIPSLKKAQTPSSLAETVESQNLVTPDSVQCYTVMPVAAPLNEWIGQEHHPAELQTVLLGPLSELTETFRTALVNNGYAVQHFIPGKETRRLGDNRFEVDFSSLESSQGLQGLLANSGQGTGAVFNLLGLPTQTGSENKEHLDDARTLFLLSKVLEQNLKDSAHRGGGWLINVTALDGQFGLGKSRDFPAGMAGTLGIAKSIAQEWNEVSVKCIDLDPDLEPNQLIAHILNEWRHQDFTLEIGYTREGRWRLDLQQRHNAHTANLSRLELDKDSVLLVTGGAYGITANIAKALAERYQSRLILVGRSPMPEQEPDATGNIKNPAELKQFLISDLWAKSTGKVRPADVDRVFKRLLKDREILANMASMRATGAEVEYHSLDLRDAQAFGTFIDGIYAKWGRIDGVLHGAGIIDDKLIRDKSLASFESVYHTKVIPAQVMASRLRPDTLKFLLFFSSIAGRFGNAGQCDYSAANEVLNKLANRLSYQWPQVHTVSINWGPWAAGMVSDELLKMYAARNILPIPLDTGTRYCIEELERGKLSESEVVITASLTRIAELMRPKTRHEIQGSKRVITSSTQAEMPELSM